MKHDFGLVVDWETSGLPDDRVPMRTYLEGPQGVEIGAILVNLPEFRPVAEYESRVRFLGTVDGITYGGPTHEALSWSADAERIHGISVSDTQMAPIPVRVAEDLVEFIKTNTGFGDLNKHRIMLCGHNPSFDAYFTRQLLFLGGKERSVQFHHRMVDTFSLGYVTYGVTSSDDLFWKISRVNRKIHSAIKDARLTLQALRNIYELCRGLNTDGK